MEKFLNKEITIKNTTGCLYKGILKEINKCSCIVYIDNFKANVMIPFKAIKQSDNIFELIENINTMSAYGVNTNKKIED